LGKGGIGKVHLVFDCVLGREVAMKSLREDFQSDGEEGAADRVREATWRFMREARVTGQLEHPNIVPVYELGRHADGTLYYTMRAVHGKTLGEALRQAKKLTDRLQLLHHFADVCQAIAYGHSRGVLHRDIKPENVMIGEYGETFVLDWGLARIALQPDAAISGQILSLPPARFEPTATAASTVGYDDHERTTVGRIVGTPQYMSPEQFMGTSENLDARSDVWSLGVMLYFLLTGRTPFGGSTLVDILSHVLAGILVPPSSLDPNVPAELEAIALRALRRDKGKRYRDAGEMAKDIVAYQSGARVNAYAYGSLALVRRFYVRHRQAVLVAGLACAALVALASSSYLRIRRARDDAQLAEQRATAGQQLANLRYADVLVEKSRSAVALDDVVDARIFAAEALAIGERPDARGVLIGLSNAVELVPASPVVTLEGCNKIIPGHAKDQLLCLSSQELKLFRGKQRVWTANVRQAQFATLFGKSNFAVLTLDRRWTAYSELDGQRLSSGELPLIAPTSFAGSPRDSWLAAGDQQGNVVVWDANRSSRIVHSLKFGQSVTAVAFAQTPHALIIGGSFGRLAIWNYVSDEPVATVGQVYSTVESVIAGPRDFVAVVGGSDGSVSIWDLAKHQPISTVLRRAAGVSSLSLSDDGRWLAAGTRTLEVDLVDMQQRARVFSMPQSLGKYRPLNFDTNGRLRLVDELGHVAAFAVSEPSPKARMLDRGNVLGVAWAPGSDLLFAGGLRESGVCVFRVADGACVDRLPVRAERLRAVALSPNGQYLVFAGAGKKIQIWDALTRLPLSVADISIEEVRSVVFDAREPYAYLAGASSEVLKFGVPSGKIVGRWKVDGQVQTMSNSPDQNRLFLGLRDGRVQIRQVNGELLHEAKGHQDWVTGVGLGPNRDFAVSVGSDGKAIIWRMPSLEILQVRAEHQGRATAVAVSPDGKVIATAGEDQIVVLSDGQFPWRQRALLQDHHGTVRCLAFDSSSSWLASGGDDAVVRLWDLRGVDINPTQVRSAISAAWHLELQGARVIDKGSSTAL
jgi:WD40 repeat protein